MKQRKRKQLLIQKQLREWYCYTVPLNDGGKVRVCENIKRPYLIHFSDEGWL